MKKHPKHLFIMCMVLSSLAWLFIPADASESPLYYPIPGDRETYMVFADGELYMVTPSAKYDTQRDIYAYDASSPLGFRPVLSDQLSEMDRPFFLKGAIYVLPYGERVMRLLQEENESQNPEEIEVLPKSAFPLSKSGDPWDEPLVDLLSVTRGNIIEYIVAQEPGEVRSLCRLDTASGVFKTYTVGPGLFGFSPVDEQSSVFYASDDKSTETHFYHIRLMNWQTGEITQRGELPFGAWCLAYDASSDSILYILKGILYQYDSKGRHTVLLEGLPEQAIDQRGFVTDDRSLLTYVMDGGIPYRLTVIKLPDKQS